MNQSSNDPANARSGLGEAVSTALRQPSFLRVMLLLAATVVVLVELFYSLRRRSGRGVLFGEPRCVVVDR